MGTLTHTCVRPANAADVSALAHLHTQSWRQAYRGQLTDAFLDGPLFDERLALWTERLAAPASHQAIWVATRADRVVGLACAFADHDERWGSLLENLHVAPEHKRQGIGQLLFETVRQWAAPRTQAGWLHLWVLANNHAAQLFYQRLGGVPKEEGTWHAPDGSRPPQWRFAWPLIPSATSSTPSLPHVANQGLRPTHPAG